MPTGPGGLDSNGIWQFGEDDSEALASDLLNLGMGSVSDAFTNLAGILQVVSTAKTDAYSSGLGGQGVFTDDVTGLTVSLTPSSATSKVLVTVYLDASQSVDGLTIVKLMRNGVDTAFIGDAAGSRVRASSGRIWYTTGSMTKHSFSYLDSPATTSAVTYSVRIATNSPATVFVNRLALDENNSGISRSASSITVMEVAG